MSRAYHCTLPRGDSNGCRVSFFASCSHSIASSSKSTTVATATPSQSDTSNFSPYQSSPCDSESRETSGTRTDIVYVVLGHFPPRKVDTFHEPEDSGAENGRHKLWTSVCLASAAREPVGMQLREEMDVSEGEDRLSERVPCVPCHLQP